MLHPASISTVDPASVSATPRLGDRVGVTCRGLLLSAMVLALVGLAVMPWDVAVARIVRAGRLPGDLGRLLNLAEAFAHGWGVAAILATALALDPGLWRSRLPQARGGSRLSAAGGLLITMAVSGGLVANAIKLVVRRVRPRAADLEAAADALATFDMSLLAAPPAGSSDVLSFPSGHAAAAAGLAAALAWRYPRGAKLFFLFALLAALQRVSSAAHYPSDICCGSAIGCATASLVLWFAARRERLRGLV